MGNSLNNTGGKQIYLRFKCTDECNFSCPFCHEEGIASRSETEMDVGLFERIISVIKKIGLLRIKFTGGEPTHCGTLKEYIRICNKNNIEDISIVTNGSQKTTITNLQDEFPRLKFTISIPGLTDVEYRNRTGSGNLGNNFIYAITSPERLKRVSVNHIVLEDEKLDVVWLENIINLSKKVDKIKLLIPCNRNFIKPQFDSKLLYKELVEFLIGQGFYVSNKKDNHIYYTRADVSNIIVAPPYCPVICANTNIVTLRLTADGILKPCFFGNDKNIHLGVNMTVAQLENEVRQLISNFRCPNTMRGALK
jgi:cyclic pyranopterin phosphate synthase